MTIYDASFDNKLFVDEPEKYTLKSGLLIKKHDDIDILKLLMVVVALQSRGT